MHIILIPGLNPESSRRVFDEIKKALPNEKFIELSSASEEELLAKKPKEKFAIIGKSMGGKVALEHQLKYNDAAALVLLAPAAEADKKFSKISAPTLIAHSKDDKLPIQNSKDFAKILPNAKLIEIESGGHSYKGSEAEVAKAVAAFVKTIS